MHGKDTTAAYLPMVRLALENLTQWLGTELTKALSP